MERYPQKRIFVAQLNVKKLREVIEKQIDLKNISKSK